LSYHHHQKLEHILSNTTEDGYFAEKNPLPISANPALTTFDLDFCLAACFAAAAEAAVGIDFKGFPNGSISDVDGGAVDAYRTGR
jgi:hypothetical protein